MQCYEALWIDEDGGCSQGSIAQGNNVRYSLVALRKKLSIAPAIFGRPHPFLEIDKCASSLQQISGKFNANYWTSNFRICQQLAQCLRAGYAHECCNDQGLARVRYLFSRQLRCGAFWPSFRNLHPYSSSVVESVSDPRLWLAMLYFLSSRVNSLQDAIMLRPHLCTCSTHFISCAAWNGPCGRLCRLSLTLPPCVQITIVTPLMITSLEKDTFLYC